MTALDSPAVLPARHAQEAVPARPEAFDLLRRASQRSNMPVRELAAQIVANTARAPQATSAAERCLKHSLAAQASVAVGQKSR